MVKSRISLIITIFSLVFIILTATLFVLEYMKINQKRERAFYNFITIQESIKDGNISLLSKTLIKNNKNMPTLRSVYLNNEHNTPIYFYSTNSLDTQKDISKIFKEDNSIFNVYFNKEIIVSDNTFQIYAAFNILSKNNIYIILKKLTILIILYLILVTSIIIYISRKKVHKNDKPNYEADIYSFSEQKITDELKKSASFDHDIVLVLVAAPNQLIKQNSSEFLEILIKNFPFKDLIFQYDENTFCILLPNIDLEKGIQQIETFDQKFVNISSRSLKFPIMFGLSSRNGRLISGNIILKEAKAALRKAMNDKNYPIIGFRPNPALYREYLSKIKHKY